MRRPASGFAITLNAIFDDRHFGRRGDQCSGNSVSSASRLNKAVLVDNTEVKLHED